MRSVLVTGSTGNVGLEVAGRLLGRGVAVRAAVLPGREADVVDGAVPVVFDFANASTYPEALSGADGVFLMRPPHMGDPKAFRPFIDAVVTSGVEQVVFLSVQGAGQNPFVPHHGIEVLLKKSDVGWTFLRPSFFMQNLSTTHCADIRERDEIAVPAGNGRTNFIDAADVGEAAAVCLTTPGHAGKAYEVTGSEALTYSEVADILSAELGRRIVYSKPSARQFKRRMKAAGHADEFVNVMGSIYGIAKLGMAAGTTRAFEELVGREPHTLAEWVQANSSCWSTST